MPDTLTNDDIAQMIEDAPRFGYVAKGVKYTTITTDALTLALTELLAARAERDAAVAEAVRGERETLAGRLEKLLWQGGRQFTDDAIVKIMLHGKYEE